jgi:cytochrome b
VAVWDGFVRAFHWGAVALVAIAFLSPDDKSVHEPIGYAVLALVAARLAWGVFGSRHARFGDFVVAPATVIRYLRALGIGRARRYLGHNPAGGMMVLALLGVLLVATLSGWLSETDRFFGVEWVSTLHSASTDVLLGLVVCHVGGVAVSSLLHGENLIGAMVTGRKARQLDYEAGAAARPVGHPDLAAMGGGDPGHDRQA